MHTTAKGMTKLIDAAQSLHSSEAALNQNKTWKQQGGRMLKAGASLSHPEIQRCLKIVHLHKDLCRNHNSHNTP